MAARLTAVAYQLLDLVGGQPVAQLGEASCELLQGHTPRMPAHSTSALDPISVLHHACAMDQWAAAVAVAASVGTGGELSRGGGEYAGGWFLIRSHPSIHLPQQPRQQLTAIQLSNLLRSSSMLLMPTSTLLLTAETSLICDVDEYLCKSDMCA
eukprot:scaffold69516_cov18-Tisochrysis_lutea.AAC.1